MNDQRFSSLITVTLMLASALLGWFSWKNDGSLSRTAPSQAVSTSEQDIVARLWEDPLQAVAVELSKKSGTSEKDDEKSKSGDRANPSNPVYDTVRQYVQEGHWVGLVVAPIPTTPFPDSVEKRLRFRYSLQMAFARQHYTPEDRNHLGYIALQENSSNSNSKTLYAPYEWFSTKPKKDSTDSAQTIIKLLLLWLPEQWLDDDPLCRLAQLERDLLFCPKQKDASYWRNHSHQRIGPVLIGPSSSDGLKSLLSSKQCSKNESACCPCADQLRHRLRIYSPHATAPDALVGLDSVEEPPLPRFQANSRIKKRLNDSSREHWRYFTNFIAADNQLTDLLVQELDLRGINPANDTILLLTEADTFYGQALPRAFQHSLQRFTNLGASHLKNVRISRYLRGLDSQKGYQTGLPNDNKNGTLSLEQQLTNLLNRQSAPAYGESQIDYVERLTANIVLQHTKGSDKAKPIKAVGILGGDIYDKLVLLKSLRANFSSALFFTTDLDARLWDPEHYRITHNLVIASSPHTYAKPEEDRIERDFVAPFRDVYQACEFNACRQALAKTKLLVETNGETPDDTNQPKAKIAEILAKTESLATNIEKALVETNQPKANVTETLAHIKKTLDDTNQPIAKIAEILAKTKCLVTDIKETLAKTKCLVTDIKETLADTNRLVTDIEKALANTKWLVPEMTQTETRRLVTNIANALANTKQSMKEPTLPGTNQPVQIMEEAWANTKQLAEIVEKARANTELLVEIMEEAWLNTEQLLKDINKTVANAELPEEDVKKVQTATRQLLKDIKMVLTTSEPLLVKEPHEPHIYEIGRNDIQQLLKAEEVEEPITRTNSAFSDHLSFFWEDLKAATRKFWEQSISTWKSPPRSINATLVLVSIGIPIGAGMLIFRWRRKDIFGPHAIMISLFGSSTGWLGLVILTSCVLLVILGKYLACLGDRPGGEAFHWLEGISIWPTELFRLGILFSVIWMLVWAWHRHRRHRQQLETAYELKAPRKANSWKPSFRRLWKCLFYRWPIIPSRNTGRSVSAQRIFTSYCRQASLPVRLTRLLPGATVYFLFGITVMVLSGFPIETHIRGISAAYLDKIILYASIIAWLGLVFYVLDAILLSTQMIHQLGVAPTKWPKNLLQKHSARWGVPHEDLDGYLDVCFAAEKTRVTGKLILLPFIIQFIMVLARNSHFDNWSWPPALLTIFTGNILLSATGWGLLRHASRKLRTQALENLNQALHTTEQNLHSKIPKPNAQRRKLGLEALKRCIEDEQRGAYARWLQDPAIIAVFLPTGLLGILSVLFQILFGQF